MVSITGDGVCSACRQADQQPELVATLPAGLLADELLPRGWMCRPPE